MPLPEHESRESRAAGEALAALKRKWRIALVHHSHTDIGYTAHQSEITRYHVDFQRRALEIIRAMRGGGRPELAGFKWSVECFWSVERFLERASDAESAEFIEACRRGDIGLSASYLHFNELIDPRLSARAVSRATRFAAERGIGLRTALSADINGYGWGYATALADAGVENFITCIHSHHGSPPAGRFHRPFQWEAHDGRRILVWLGEHYVLGNELGLCPGGVESYSIRDGQRTTPRGTDHALAALRRLPRYLAELDRAGYELPFLPIHVQGLLTDNGPPNGGIAAFANEWNERFGEFVHIAMATPDEMMAMVRDAAGDAPVHRGDWPDWWSDGYASTPEATRVFRDAQRRFLQYEPDVRADDARGRERRRAAEDNLLHFAEHTWNHSEAMSAPWHLSVQRVGLRAKAYAALAGEHVQEMQMDFEQRRGGRYLDPDRGCVYRVANTNPFACAGIAELPVWSYECGVLNVSGVVSDAETGEVLPSQCVPIPRGYAFTVPMELGAGEERLLRLAAGEGPAEPFAITLPRGGTDGVVDLADPDAQLQASASGLRSPHVEVAWRLGGGIESLRLASLGIDIPGGADGLFSLVHERTPVAPEADDVEMMLVRRRMGRNRRGTGVVRASSRIARVRRADAGAFSATVELDLECAGVDRARIALTAYAGAPRLDVALRFNKASLWEPENLLAVLPSQESLPGAELWLDKGVPVRPLKDQIPGTLADFFTVQSGLCLALAGGGGIAIASPDAGIVHLGPLEPGERRLAGDPALASRPKHLYSWLMTNYWETNFDASLAGFHEFRYTLLWGPDLGDPEQAFQACRGANSPFDVFRVEAGDAQAGHA